MNLALLLKGIRGNVLLKAEGSDHLVNCLDAKKECVHRTKNKSAGWWRRSRWWHWDFVKKKRKESRELVTRSLAYLIFSPLLPHPLFHAFLLLSVVISSGLSYWIQITESTASMFPSSNKVSPKLPLLPFSFLVINPISCTCSVPPPASLPSSGTPHPAGLECCWLIMRFIWDYSR